MGRLDAPSSDPLGITGILRLASFVPGLHAIGAIDPSRNSPDHLRRVEAVLKPRARSRPSRRTWAISTTAPTAPDTSRITSWPRSTSSPWSSTPATPIRARPRSGSPIRSLVDDVAVDHPDVRFVLAHFGNPWLVDAAEVVYKNDNVWADLSGLIVGDEALFRVISRRGSRSRTIDDAILDVRKAIPVHRQARPIPLRERLAARPDGLVSEADRGDRPQARRSGPPSSTTESPEALFGLETIRRASP